MPIKESKKKGLADSPTFVTARRALGITRIYIVIAIVFSVIAITLWGQVMFVNLGASSTSNSILNTTTNTISNVISNITSNSIASNAILAAKSSMGNSGTPLLAVPLDMVPILMIATPVVLLFVYDKNNGVLEYMLSLGMTQRDIYMQYLKATLLLTSVFSIVFVSVDLAFVYITHGAAALAILFPIPLITIPFSLAIVSFMVISMMAFSSLQKTRAGSNQPLGLAIGWAITIPGYIVAIVLPFNVGIYADLAIAAVIAIVVFIFLSSSERLIRREKFLP